MLFSLSAIFMSEFLADLEAAENSSTSWTIEISLSLISLTLIPDQGEVACFLDDEIVRDYSLTSPLPSSTIFMASSKFFI